MNYYGTTKRFAHEDGLGHSDDERREIYRSLFERCLESNVEDDIRRATNGNYVLGEEQFQKEIGHMLQRRVVPGRSGRPMKTEA